MVKIGILIKLFFCLSLKDLYLNLKKKEDFNINYFEFIGG